MRSQVFPPISRVRIASATSTVAGTRNVSIATLRPFRTRAAMPKSSILPPVQEPM